MPEQADLIDTIINSEGECEGIDNEKSLINTIHDEDMETNDIDNSNENENSTKFKFVSKIAINDFN
jgi:hypothetical protein